MTVDEAIAIAETALNYDRLNKVQEIVFRQSWEGRSYIEIVLKAQAMNMIISKMLVLNYGNYYQKH